MSPAEDAIRRQPVIDRIHGQIMNESRRALVKHGQQIDAPFYVDGYGRSILDGDICKRRTDVRFANGVGSWTDILVEEVAEAIDEAAAGNIAELRAELIQVASVAARWVENIDLMGPEPRDSPPLVELPPPEPMFCDHCGKPVAFGVVDKNHTHCADLDGDVWNCSKGTGPGWHAVNGIDYYGGIDD